MRSAYTREWLSRADARARFADFFDAIEQDGQERARSREGDVRARISVVDRDDSVRELALGVASSAVPKRTRGIRRFAFPITLVFGFAAVHASQVVPVAARGQMHGDVRDEVRERSSVMASNRALALLASVAGVAGLSCVDGALGDAVEWRVADGGNGHWYELVLSGPITWPDARAACEVRGGHLVTPTSAAESAHLLSIANRAQHPTAWVNDFGGNAGGPWLGGYQPAGANPAQPWAWVTGELWDWTGWATGEPNGGFGPGVAVTLMLGWAGSDTYRGWADGGLFDYPPYPLPPSYVIEYSADCNSNGIVDYGEIRNGFIEDTNGNNTPDACECAADPSLPICCPADVIEDSAVNAIDLAAILNTWGTDGGKFPRADVDGSGVVDGADLAAVLSEWGPCAK
jgi:hypothetical protein